MPVLSREPEVGDRLPVKEGASGQIVELFANSRGNVQGFPGFVSMEVLSSEVGDEVLVITRWQDKDAFDSWVHSDAFKRAHDRSGGGDLLRGHPQMSTYEVAVERESESPGE
jgi:heme-degrading monooxygenase HmoA